MSNPLLWIKGNDTGISSKTIWQVMTGITLWELTPGAPCDPDDFGRCYRLLQQFPEWESRLSEVAQQYPAWTLFVREWPRMKSLWERESPKGTCPKLYALMKELGKESREQ